MSLHKKARVALVGLAAGAMALSACSAGSLGSSSGSTAAAANTTITYLVDNGDTNVKTATALIAAYNALNTMLAETTKYNPDTKTAGSLQGDSTAVGLQNALRGMMRSVTSSSPFSRLLDVGIEAQQGGKLEIKADKLNAALGNVDGLRSLFTTTSTDPTSQGFGLKIKAFADGLISATGTLSTKTDSLQSAIKRNTTEQSKVNDRASRAESRYLAQYNAMDAAVGRLSGLNAFVSQQITMWNRNTG